MKRSFIIELYRKYLAGAASQDESELLERHYDLFKDKHDGISGLSSKETDELGDEIEKRIDDQIRKNERSGTRRTFLFSAVSLAACLLLAIPFFLKTTDSPKDQLTADRNVKADSNRFVLLPDSTLVVLTAGSRLTYPESFHGSPSREVILEGEAYFDVKKSAGKPFIIISGSLRTTVLGTAFTVSAWPDKNATVTVERGKVQVEDVGNGHLGIISPNHQIVYSPGKAIETRLVKSVDYIKWRDEDLLLSEVSFEEAGLLLEDRYNVKIQIQDRTLQNLRFTTKVKKGEGVQSVLRGLAEFNNAEVKFDSVRATYTVSPISTFHSRTK